MIEGSIGVPQQQVQSVPLQFVHTVLCLSVYDWLMHIVHDYQHMTTGQYGECIAQFLQNSPTSSHYCASALLVCHYMTFLFIKGGEFSA